MEEMGTKIRERIIFEELDTKINPDSGELEYHRRANSKKTAVGWGQRKLFLTEVQFLTIHCDHPNPVVVYAGAAPGYHIPLLESMFPDIEWHLYDPRSFGIRPSKNISIHQQYFMNSDAEKWAGRNDVFFISDIRTADYKSQGKLDNEQSVISDNKMQEEWYNIIKPVKAHLKFRLPYFQDYPIDREYTYLSGTVYKQPWAPQSSTETRLVPDGNGQVVWDVEKYEKQLFYHNSVIRELQRYKTLPSGELSDDFDSCLERKIFEDYLTKLGSFSEENLEGLVKLLTVTLNNGRRQSEWVTLAKLRKDPFLMKRKFMNDE